MFWLCWILVVALGIYVVSCKLFLWGAWTLLYGVGSVSSCGMQV